MAKLTLSVNPFVIARAKRYAKRHGISVSKMVESYLGVISMPRAAEAVPPLLRALKGILKKADPKEYREHLSETYR